MVFEYVIIYMLETLRLKKNTVMFDEALVLFPPAVSWKETDWSVTSSLVVY